MTIRRVITNAGRGWVSTQDGTAANEYQGSWGLQAAYNACSAGDIVAVQGADFASVDVAYNDILAPEVTTTNDKTGTWAVGDVVRNNVGSGDDWTGRIGSYVSATKKMRVSLDTGTYNTINIADGIENVTRGETDTLAAKIYSPFTMDKAGTYNGGHISILPYDSSWNLDYTKMYKIIGIYSYALYWSADYNTLAGAWINGVANTPTYGLYCSGADCIIYRCYSNSASRNAITLLAQRTKLINCLVDGTGSGGYSAVLANASNQYLIANKILNSQLHGAEVVNNTICVDNIIHNSVRNNINYSFSLGAVVLGNTLDKTGAGYAGLYLTSGASTALKGNFIFGNRVTNCATYGIEVSTADHSQIEMYNYFQNNTSGDRLNIDVGIGSVSGADANCGYADANYDTSHDFTLAAAASLRRTAIPMDVILATVLNNLYVTAGLTQNDMGYTNFPIFGQHVIT